MIEKVDKNINDLISQLTKDQQKQSIIKALLQRLQKDKWLKPVSECSYIWKDGKYKKPVGECGYIWNDNVTLYSIAFWIISVEAKLNLTGTKIKWKVFEELFNLKRGCLKLAKQRLSYKINYGSIEQQNQIKTLRQYVFVEDSKTEQKENSGKHNINGFGECAENLTVDVWKQSLLVEYLEKLEADGWLIKKGNGYIWRTGTTKLLIAYWVDQININFGLSKIYGGANEQNKTIWKPFEKLFNLKLGSLRNTKANWLKINNGEFKPNGWEKIEPYTIYFQSSKQDKWRVKQMNYIKFIKANSNL